jgi:predicted nuclease with TOPRIM domain
MLLHACVCVSILQQARHPTSSALAVANSEKASMITAMQQQQARVQELESTNTELRNSNSRLLRTYRSCEHSLFDARLRLYDLEDQQVEHVE